MSLRDSLEDRFISGDVADSSSVPSIEWSALGLGVLGSALLASIVGFAESILGAAAWVTESLLGAAAWTIELGESFGAIASSTTSAAVASWESFVGAFGPAALPVSVAMGFGMMMVVFWVVGNVR